MGAAPIGEEPAEVGERLGEPRAVLSRARRAGPRASDSPRRPELGAQSSESDRQLESVRHDRLGDKGALWRATAESGGSIENQRSQARSSPASAPPTASGRGAPASGVG